MHKGAVDNYVEKEEDKMEIVNEVLDGIIVGVIVFGLVSIIDNLQIIKENTTPTCACEVSE